MRMLSLLIPAALSLMIWPRLVTCQSKSLPKQVRADRSHLSQMVAVPTTIHKNSINPLAIDISAQRIRGASSKIWRGFDFTAEAEPISQNWDVIDSSLRKNGALLLRCDPFRGNPVKMDANGSALVNWASADSLLTRLSTSGFGIDLSISPPEALSASAWKQFITQAVQRYGKDPKWNISRWELHSKAEEAKALFPIFTRVIRENSPAAPVDFHLESGNPLEALTILAEICDKNRVACDCFSWKTPESPRLIFENIREIHNGIAKLPSLKAATLLPVFSSSLGGSAASAMLSAAIHLPEIAPLDGPNPALGFLLEGSEAFNPNGQLSDVGTAVQLLDRIAGTVVMSSSSEPSLHAIAARSRKGTSVLIWRDGNEKYPEEKNCLLRIHGLTPGRADGLRLSTTYRSTKVVLTSDLPPVSPQGEIEIKSVLPENSYALQEINPHARSPLEVKIGPSSGSTASETGDLFYSGNTLELIAAVQNISTKPQSITLSVEGSHSGMASSELSQRAIGVVPPGITKMLRFRLTAPRVSRSEQAGFNFRFGEQSAASYHFCTDSAVTALLENSRVDLSSPSDKAVFRVKLVNHSAAPVPVTIETANGKKDTFDLPGGGKPYIRRVETAVLSSDPGIYPSQIRISSDIGSLYSLIGQISLPAICRYARIKPVIDGNLSEWTNAVALGMGRKEQVHEKEWAGPNDLSAYAYVQWDETYFYFACAVTDNIAYQPLGAREMWKGDSVQFALTTDTTGSNQREGFGPTDHMFGIALSDTGKTISIRFSGAGGSEKIISSAKRVGVRTYYEAAIPWSELVPAKPNSGTTYGLSIVVNDSDGHGRGYISWANGIYPNRRPGLFLPLRLLK